MQMTHQLTKAQLAFAIGSIFAFLWGVDFIHYVVMQGHRTRFAPWPYYHLFIAGWQIAVGMLVVLSPLYRFARKEAWRYFRNMRYENIAFFGFFSTYIWWCFLFRYEGFEAYGSSHGLAGLSVLDALLSHVFRLIVGSSLESIFLFLPLLIIHRRFVHRWGRWKWLALIAAVYFGFVLSHPERVFFWDIWYVSVYFFFTLYAAINQQSIWLPIFWHIVWNQYVLLWSVTQHADVYVFGPADPWFKILINLFSIFPLIVGSGWILDKFRTRGQK